MSLAQDVAPPVTNAEVSSYATPGCKDCRGSGYIESFVCECAGVRFMRYRRDDIVMREDGMYWRAGK